MTKTGHYSDMQTNNDTWKSLTRIAVETYLNTDDLIVCGTYIVSLFIL